ncbi:hypothetical protein RRSWK_04401 [Rhodopirellula sp. SWK7]|nr:hypothetical protein RRSWK_04401 [Rhodopirellula sp. SWK7]
MTRWGRRMFVLACDLDRLSRGIGQTRKMRQVSMARIQSRRRFPSDALQLQKRKGTPV